jgi:hypothetical protein
VTGTRHANKAALGICAGKGVSPVGRRKESEPQIEKRGAQGPRGVISEEVGDNMVDVETECRPTKVTVYPRRSEQARILTAKAAEGWTSDRDMMVETLQNRATKTAARRPSIKLYDSEKAKDVQR